MQTYYKLEDYHWDIINRYEYVKDKKIWFVDINSCDKIIDKGIIIGHGIHIEGHITLQLRVVRETEYSTPDHIWVDSETERKQIVRRSYTMKVFMDNCFHTREEAVERGIFLLDRSIGDLQSRIKYEQRKLDELRKEKNND